MGEAQSEREIAAKRLLEEPNADNLWAAVIAFENYPLKTTSGLDFTYSFKINRRGEKGNEIVVSRKEKTLTRSSVEKALKTLLARGDRFPVKMSTPKELNVFGASYIYPLFICLGLAEHVGSSQRGGRRKGSKKRADSAD